MGLGLGLGRRVGGLARPFIEAELGGVRWDIIIVFVAVASLPCSLSSHFASPPPPLLLFFPLLLACAFVSVVVADKAPQALTAYYKS